MSISAAQALRRQRGEIAVRAGELVTAAEAEDRELTTEERTSWTAMHADCESLLRRAVRLEEQADLNNSLDRQAPDTDPAGVRSVAAQLDRDGQDDPDAVASRTLEQSQREYGQAFEGWMRHGPPGITERAADILGRNRIELEPEQRTLVLDQLVEAGMVRAQTTAVDTAGGFMVPNDLMQPIVSSAKAWGGMLAASNVLVTATGRDIPIPTDDDVANEATIVAQNAEHGEQDVVIGQVLLLAHMYSSKFVRCPIAFLQDSQQDVNAWLGNKLGIRMGRGQNRDATTGSGTAEPQGFTVGSPVGHTTASSSAFTRTELLTVKHSVDPAHRLNARWMCNDNTVLNMKLLVDGNGRPLWQAGMTAREDDTIDGDPYTVNQHMVNIGSNALFLGYGDFSYYYIRQVRSTTLLRLTERFAEFGQVGFLMFQRMDGKMVDPGSGPIKMLKAAA